MCVSGLAVLSFVSFVLPVGQLLVWALSELPEDWGSLISITGNSFTVAGLSAVTVVVLSLILTFAYRFFPIPRVQLANRLSVLGYAFPGAVLAIGLYLPLLRIDNFIADSFVAAFDWDPGLIISGGLSIMVIGLSIRYLAVGHGAIRTAQSRVSRRIDEAANIFGVYGLKQLRLIHLPILWRAILGASVLVFIDVVKEMPLTLMTRPFGWDTLAVRVFELISEGEWERAALPSLLIVLLGMIPVLFFRSEKS